MTALNYNDTCAVSMNSEAYDYDMQTNVYI